MYEKNESKKLGARVFETATFSIAGHKDTPYIIFMPAVNESTTLLLK